MDITENFDTNDFEKMRWFAIWLDDERDPKNEGIQKKFGANERYTWCKTVESALEFAHNMYAISFDHDLGCDENGKPRKSGYELASHIERLAARNEIGRIAWRVHSMNPVGARKIAEAMKQADIWWDKYEAEAEAKRPHHEKLRDALKEFGLGLELNYESCLEPSYDVTFRYPARYRGDEKAIGGIITPVVTKVCVVYSNGKPVLLLNKSRPNDPGTIKVEGLNELASLVAKEVASDDSIEVVWEKHNRSCWEGIVGKENVVDK